MNILTRIALVLAAVLAGSAPSEAGLFGRRQARVQTFQGGSCAGGACQVSQAGGYTYAYQSTTTTTAVATSGGYGGFLARLNAVRASHGRPPLAWSDQLAAAAALNGRGHTYNPGCGQCWSSTTSPDASLSMWLASQAHFNILMSGSTIGVAANGSGLTANVR